MWCCCSATRSSDAGGCGRWLGQQTVRFLHRRLLFITHLKEVLAATRFWLQLTSVVVSAHPFFQKMCHILDADNDVVFIRIFYLLLHDLTVQPAGTQLRSDQMLENILPLLKNENIIFPCIHYVQKQTYVLQRMENIRTGTLPSEYTGLQVSCL